MDEFLNIIYTNYADESKISDDYMKYFGNVSEKLKEIVSIELYEDFENIFTDCIVDNNRHYFVEGMKLAIQIMNKKYIPKV